MEDDSDEWKWWIPTGVIVVAIVHGLMIMLMSMG